MYKLLQDDGVLRLSDGANIPNDPLNTDWLEYQAWLAAGGIPQPADELTAEELALEAEVNQAPISARNWFVANPQAQQLFTLSLVDLQTEIYTRVDLLFPAATAGNRTFMKLLLMALAVCVRVLVKRERL